MAASHFEDGLQQRAWLAENDDEQERDAEVIRAVLNDNLQLIEEGFSPRNIESLDGASDDVVEAASGETIEDLDLERVADYLATEKWNYPFDADISQGEAEIGTEEAHFDLWHRGSVKVRASYEDVDAARPGIRAVGNVYPDRQLEFDANLYSRKPKNAQDKYEEAVQAKRNALVEELKENQDEMAEYLEIDREKIPEVDEENISPILDLTSEFALKYALEDQRSRDNEYWRLAQEGQALVVEDAVERFQDFGITLDPEGDFEDFQDYDEMIEAVRNGEVTTLMVDLEAPENVPLRLSLYAEDGLTLGFDEASSVGYELRAFDEAGLETLTEFYEVNC